MWDEIISLQAERQKIRLGGLAVFMTHADFTELYKRDRIGLITRQKAFRVNGGNIFRVLINTKSASDAAVINDYVDIINEMIEIETNVDYLSTSDRNLAGADIFMVGGTDITLKWSKLQSGELDFATVSTDSVERDDQQRLWLEVIHALSKQYEANGGAPFEKEYDKFRNALPQQF